jgi:hypothetical protein
MSVSAFKFIARLFGTSGLLVNTPIADGDRVDQALAKLQAQINAASASAPPVVMTQDYNLPVGQTVIGMPITIGPHRIVGVSGAVLVGKG